MSQTYPIIFHTEVTPGGQPIAGALIRSTPPTPAAPGPWNALTDAAGNFTANLSLGAYHAEISAPGYVTAERDWVFGSPPPDGFTVRIGLAPATSLLPRVFAGRWGFFTEVGPYVVAGSTELMLGWRYDLEGPDAIRLVLDERRTCRFNNLRVLWQKGPGSNGLTEPWQMPAGKLPGFLGLLAEYGFYCEGVILADQQFFGDPHLRVGQVRNATVGVANLLKQLGNEYEKNGFDPAQFAKPTDRTAANASSIEGGKDAPYWDFFCFSGQRSPINHAIREYGPLEFLYAEGAPGWGGVPPLCDEGFKPGVQSSDPRDWFRAGAQARSGCGGRFHSEAGTAGNSRLFTELERDCAHAFTKGLLG